jgi:hypothetical protein
MIKKTFLFFVLIVLISFTGCDGDDPPYKKVLNVPYYFQVEYNFCAPACMQMWIKYEMGYYYNQYDIAAYIGLGSYGGIDPYSVRDGMRYYTYLMAHVAYRYCNEDGAHGDLVAVCIEAIRDGFPSIMPFYSADHAVLVTGFEWHKENGRPIAEVMYYHDPNQYYGPNMVISGSQLEYTFTPIQCILYVIIADSWFDYIGPVRHDSFVLNLGTYYGGPPIYDPKGLLDDLPEDPEEPEQ